MNKALPSLVVLILLGAACARFWESPPPAPLFARPLSSTGVAACLDALRRAGVPCQLDRQGSGLLVEPAQLERARAELVQRGLPASSESRAEPTEIPTELRQALAQLPGVAAASVRIVGDEALLMLDIQEHPPRSFIDSVVDAVVVARPRIARANVKVVDAQCRDWTAIPEKPELQRLRPLRQSLIERTLQQKLDGTLCRGKGRVRLAVTYLYAPPSWAGEKPGNKLRLQVSLLLVPLSSGERNRALIIVKEVRDLWPVIESRGDRFSLEVSPWPASQRPCWPRGWPGGVG